MSYEYNLDINIWEEDGEYFYYVIQQHGRGKSTVLATGSADKAEEALEAAGEAIRDVLL